MLFHIENFGAGSVSDDAIGSELAAHILMEKAYIPRKQLMYTKILLQKCVRRMRPQVRVEEVICNGCSNRWDHRWPRT